MMKFEKWASERLDVVTMDAQEANCRCPFHDDHRPSFRFNLRTGLWICHGCGLRGNYRQLVSMMQVPGEDGDETVEDLLSQIDEHIQAVEKLQDELRSSIPDGWLARYTSDQEAAFKYWCNKRGMTKTEVIDWQLGWDSLAEAGTIPLRDFHGNLMGVIKRFAEDTGMGKYLYPKGFSRKTTLWGVDRLGYEKVVAVTEGALDAIGAVKVGIPAVAMLGSSLSLEQGYLLDRAGVETVVALTDNDAAGSNAVVSMDRYLPRGIQLFVADWQLFNVLHHMSDPFEASRHHPQDLRRMFRESIPFHQWYDWSD